MTTSAITQSFRICQSNLGVKIHDAKDPGHHLGPMFRQVLSALFSLMERYERATGGLDDTIVPFDGKTKKGNEFKFRPYESGAFLSAIRQAIDLFSDANSWKGLMGNNMKEDFSWDRSARSYLELYRSVVNG
jgi:hypothetical protein